MATEYSPDRNVKRLASSRSLSPERNTTKATSVDELVAGQLAHFGIRPESDFGTVLARIAARLYESQADIDELWRTTLIAISKLERSDQIGYFNAKNSSVFNS
jgi:hypothetical protein